MLRATWGKLSVSLFSTQAPSRPLTECILQASAPISSPAPHQTNLFTAASAKSVTLLFLHSSRPSRTAVSTSVLDALIRSLPFYQTRFSLIFSTIRHYQTLLLAILQFNFTIVLHISQNKPLSLCLSLFYLYLLFQFISGLEMYPRRSFWFPLFRF